MAGEYKAQCGCKIHVAQWTVKRKVVTQESCSLHKAAPELLAACKAMVNWDNNFPDMMGIDFQTVKSQIEAAIAKAEGRDAE